MLIYLKHTKNYHSSQRRNTCLKISGSCNQISNNVQENLWFLNSTLNLHMQIFQLTLTCLNLDSEKGEKNFSRCLKTTLS